MGQGMVQAITGFNPEYTLKNRRISSVQQNNANKLPVFENSFLGNLRDDIDILDFKADKQIQVPSCFVPTENPFIPRPTLYTQTLPTIDPSTASDINIFKTVPRTLQADIEKLEAKTKEKYGTEQALLYALSPLPPIRRTQSLPDTVKENNWPRAGLLLGMAAMNFPRDLGEMKRAWDEGASILKQGIAGTPFSDAQRPFYLLKGTIVEKLAKKYPSIKRIYNSLNNFDNTLYHTKFGDFIKKSFNVKDVKERIIKGTGFGAVTEKGYEFSGNYFRKVIGKTLLRISKLSLATSALLEVPALVKSLTKGETVKDKTKSFTKQLCKSAGYVALVTGGIAVAGAMVAPSLIASLVGMGIGASIGLMASKSLNKQIDKAFT